MLSQGGALWFRAKSAARYIKRLTPARGALVDCKDKHVALAPNRERTVQNPHSWFAVGWLSAAAAADAKACGAAIQQIARQEVLEGRVVWTACREQRAVVFTA